MLQMEYNYQRWYGASFCYQISCGKTVHAIPVFILYFQKDDSNYYFISTLNDLDWRLPSTFVRQCVHQNQKKTAFLKILFCFVHEYTFLATGI